MGKFRRGNPENGHGNGSGASNGKEISSYISERYPNYMNIEKQKKHIEGAKEYVKGKSIITTSIDELDRMYQAKRMKVLEINNHKGRLVFDKIIGIYHDTKTNEWIETNVGTIHYSKTGYHIVPADPRDRRN